jgi:16S rRNA (guanine1516-N2)-methyltransferase
MIALNKRIIFYTKMTNYIYINQVTNKIYLNIYNKNNNKNNTQIKNPQDLINIINNPNNNPNNNPIIIINNITKTLLTKPKQINSKIREFYKKSELNDFINNHKIWCEQGVSIDFNNPKIYLRCKTLSKSDLLIKACGKKTPDHIIDATAGLGTDSFILSTAFKDTKISLIEENEIISLLLKNGIKNGLEDSSYPETQKTCEKMELHNGNAINIIPKLEPADIIYLDPMFADNSFKGAVKKPMQILHKICPPPSNNQINKLLEIALNNAKNRVIVKRAKSACVINLNNSIKPNHQISGKSIRYDVYLQKS